MGTIAGDGWDVDIGGADAAAGRPASADAWDAALAAEPPGPGHAAPDPPDRDAGAQGMDDAEAGGPGAERLLSPGRVMLPATPDPAALRLSLIEALASGSPRVEAAAVERLPGPVLQVLLAAMRDERAAGRSLAVVNPSFAFSLAFEAYGFGADNEPFTVEYT